MRELHRTHEPARSVNNEGHVMKSDSATDRAAKTRRQMHLMEKALTEEFPSLLGNVVRDEVAAISKEIFVTALRAPLRGTDGAAAHLQTRVAAERDVVATTS